MALNVHSSMSMPYQFCAYSIWRKAHYRDSVNQTESLNLGVYAHTLQISKENTGIAYDSAHTHFDVVYVSDYKRD